MDILKQVLDGVTLSIKMSTRVNNETEWLTIDEVKGLSDIDTRAAKPPKSMKANQFDIKTIKGSPFVVRKSDNKALAFVNPQVKQTLTMSFDGVEVGTLIGEQAMKSIRIAVQRTVCRIKGTKWMLENPEFTMKYDELKKDSRTLEPFELVRRAADRADDDTETIEEMIEFLEGRLKDKKSKK